MFDTALTNGHIRLAVPVDTAIYYLISTHCASGAKQAEAIINMSLKGNYIPSHHLTNFQVMPPIIKFCSSTDSWPGDVTPRGASSLSESTNSDSLYSSIGTESCSGSIGRFQSVALLLRERNLSNCSNSTGEISSTSSRKISNVSALSNEINMTCSNSLTSDWVSTSEDQTDSAYQSSESSVCARRKEFDLIMEDKKSSNGAALTTKQHFPQWQQKQPNYSLATLFKGRERKKNIFKHTRSDSTSSDMSASSDTLRFIPGDNQWNTSIMDNNTIIAQYGDTAYPIVWWDPKFKIDFCLNTSIGPLSDSVVGIDLSKPDVNLKVFNNSPKRIGFAIRSNRLSTVYKTHIVYPNRGLAIIDPYKSWEEKLELFPSNPDIMEMFGIDLFFCTMDTKPVWNIVRKYAIMKTKKR